MADVVEFLTKTTIQVKGKFASQYIFQTRNNKQYVRTYFIPDNPKKPSQQVRRSLFHLAVRNWQMLPETEKEWWRRNGRTYINHLRGYHLYISLFMKEGVEMAVKQVISGYEELGEGVHILTIPEVDPTRSIIIYNSCLAGNFAGRSIFIWGVVYARIISSTQIEVYIKQSGVEELVPFSYSVIEYI